MDLLIKVAGAVRSIKAVALCADAVRSPISRTGTSPPLLRPGSLGPGSGVTAHVSSIQTHSDHFYYPDVMVACGPESADPLVEDGPCLVVEVASPSTTIIDQREKLVAYKRVPTVEAYLIVEQDRRRVHRFWRDADGVWSDDEVSGHGDVPLPCPRTTLRRDLRRHRGATRLTSASTGRRAETRPPLKLFAPFRCIKGLRAPLDGRRTTPCARGRHDLPH